MDATFLIAEMALMHVKKDLDIHSFVVVLKSENTELRAYPFARATEGRMDLFLGLVGQKLFRLDML